MIYKIDISEKDNLLTVTPEGIYSMNKILDLVHIVIENPLFKPTTNLIIDIRAVKYTPVISEIFSISEFFVSMKKHFKGKTAIVVQGDVFYNMFKLSTMFVAKQGLKSNIFRDMEKALAWLAVPDSIELN